MEKQKLRLVSILLALSLIVVMTGCDNPFADDDSDPPPTALGPVLSIVGPVYMENDDGTAPIAWDPAAAGAVKIMTDFDVAALNVEQTDNLATLAITVGPFTDAQIATMETIAGRVAEANEYFFGGASTMTVTDGDARFVGLDELVVQDAGGGKIGDITLGTFNTYEYSELLTLENWSITEVEFLYTDRAVTATTNGPQDTDSEEFNFATNNKVNVSISLAPGWNVVAHTYSRAGDTFTYTMATSPIPAGSIWTFWDN